MSLDEIIQDVRLSRLFSVNGAECAVQLWVLQILKGGVRTSKITYGRILPYSFSNDKWSAPQEDRFRSFDGYSAQLICISLYCSSMKVPDLLRRLCSGSEIRQISAAHGFKNPASFDVRFGGIKLSEKLIFRATSYLPMRNDHGERGVKSPHGAAGAFSAAILQEDKVRAFDVDNRLDRDLLDYVVKSLNGDTGLRFDNEDAERIGDLELLVFPTLNQNEQSLLEVEWAKKGEVLRISILSNPFVGYTSYFIRGRFENNGQAVYSTVLCVPAVEGTVAPVEMPLPPHLSNIIDRCHIEIHGVSPGQDAVLYAQWGCHYVREISFGISAGSHSGHIQLDWLTKVTKLPADSARLKNAQAVGHSSGERSSLVGGRKGDPWVPVNRRVQWLLGRFAPPKSQGQFFERYSEGNGLGRLEFVEWLKGILQEHAGKQVIFFDPYFEDVGVSLLMPNASSKGSYVVFTSAPRENDSVGKQGWLARLSSKCRELFLGNRKPDRKSNRINNLLAACERFLPIVSNIKLKVFALQNEPLHDRYILIIGGDGEPISGFHLSNSIQKATENYPLLITPMPGDVLLKVTEYSEALLHRLLGEEVEQGADQKAPPALIFDSAVVANQRSPRIRYEPLAFLEKADAGNVLAVWTGRAELARLHGEKLHQKLVEISLMKDNSLRGDEFSGAHGLIRLAKKVTPEDFYRYWDITGDILANTPSGDIHFASAVLQNTVFPSLLLRYLAERSLINDRPAVDSPEAVALNSYFDSTLDELLHSSIRTDFFFRPTKFKQLTWGEYFAIKILLGMNSEQLLDFLVEPESYGPGLGIGREKSQFIAIRAQAVGEITLSLDSGGEDLPSLLVRSKSQFFRWLAYSGLESSLGLVCGEASVIEEVIEDNEERIRVLGWLINRSAYSRVLPPVTSVLANKLISLLPPTLDEGTTRLLIHACLGHMKNLGYCVPWMADQIVFPLLLKDRISIDHLVDIWLEQIETSFDGILNGSNSLFREQIEGNTTRLASFLIANASPGKRSQVFARLGKCLSKVRRDIQLPLSSTTNWRRWDASLKVAFWIYGMVKWIYDFIPLPSEGECELFRIWEEAKLLSHMRPVSDWSESTYAGGEFAVFLRTREELEGA